MLLRRRAPRRSEIVTPSGLRPYLVMRGAFYTDASRSTSRHMEHVFAVDTLASEPRQVPNWADYEAHLSDELREGVGPVVTMPLWAWWWPYAPAGPLEYTLEWRRPR